MTKFFDNFDNIRKRLPADTLPVLFFISFALWFFSFRGFIFDRLALASDAVAYYEHFKYYIDQITRGVYPLWDPSRNYGIPNEFFLRRIGSFNPFFLLIVIFNKLGLSVRLSYSFFMAAYYFFGMTGFYLLANRIFQNRVAAFTSFLLLMFSSLGTRMFDSYLLFTFIPLVWFFYFLTAFSQKPDKRLLLGMTLCLMIMMTTYIPFYFVTIFFCFVVCFAFVYFKNLKALFTRYAKFIKGHKLIVFFCIASLIFSLLPSVILYKEVGTGEVVLPLRHGDASEENALVVDKENIVRWSIPEDVFFSRFFGGSLKRFQFAIFYLPLFTYLLLLFGLFTETNKKNVLLVLSGFLILLIGIPKITPVYEFLYDKVFFFKYLRNLHFFLWLILLPLFILALGEQFSQLLNYQSRRKKEKVIGLACITAVHAGVLSFIVIQGNSLFSSYLVVGLSLTFFILAFRGWFKGKAETALVFMLLIVTVQPLEVFHYLQQNAEEKPFFPYRYDREYMYPLLREGEKEIKPVKRQSSLKEIAEILRSPNKVKRHSMYFGGKWYYELVRNVDAAALDDYLTYKIVLYDRVELMEERNVSYRKLERVFSENLNIAYVALAEGTKRPGPMPRRVKPRAVFVTAGSKEVEVLLHDVNQVRLRTNLDSPKFLIYNDNFHSGWQAFLNGKPAPLWRANHSFKGVWVPAGENVVTFRYGPGWRYALTFLLLGLFYFIFFRLLYLTFKAYPLSFGVKKGKKG